MRRPEDEIAASQRESMLRVFWSRLKEHPLARMGPGLITGVADDDPSGIANWFWAYLTYGAGVRLITGGGSATGKRAVFGPDSRLQKDPHFRDYLLFYEYFHGDSGRGAGASHQTGWTGLVAKVLMPRALGSSDGTGRQPPQPITPLA